MKKYLCLIKLLFVFAFNANAQTTVDTTIKVQEKKSAIIFNKFDDEEQVFYKLEVEAKFPGGEKKWTEFLQQNVNLNISKENNAPKGNYTVVIRFIVARDGKLYELTPETNNGFGMENEIMRIIQNGPNWIPGKQNGVKVNSIKRQDVTFQIK